jgi:hypothetical protein
MDDCLDLQPVKVSHLLAHTKSPTTSCRVENAASCPFSNIFCKNNLNFLLGARDCHVGSFVSAILNFFIIRASFRILRKGVQPRPSGRVTGLGIGRIDTNKFEGEVQDKRTES